MDSHKPAFHDFDELPGPIAGPPASSPPPAPSFTSNIAWLALGVTLTAFALGSPGCMSCGRPAVSAKADVSVKETGLVAHVGGGGAGSGGTGELVGSISLEIHWPAK